MVVRLLAPPRLLIPPVALSAILPSHSQKSSFQLYIKYIVPLTTPYTYGSCPRSLYIDAVYIEYDIHD